MASVDQQKAALFSITKYIPNKVSFFKKETKENPHSNLILALVFCDDSVLYK